MDALYSVNLFAPGECPHAPECEKLSDVFIYISVDEPWLFVTATFQRVLISFVIRQTRNLCKLNYSALSRLPLWKDIPYELQRSLRLHFTREFDCQFIEHPQLFITLALYT